jgi:hypothetical protein
MTTMTSLKINTICCEFVNALYDIMAAKRAKYDAMIARIIDLKNTMAKLAQSSDSAGAYAAEIDALECEAEAMFFATSDAHAEWVKAGELVGRLAAKKYMLGTP